MTRSHDAAHACGLFLVLGLCLQGQHGSAQEPTFTTPPRLFGVIADAAEQAAAIERMAVGAGSNRSTSFEVVTRHRPNGNIALQALSAEVGSLAHVTVSASGSDGTQTSISIQTMSVPGGENATTVHAVTIGLDGLLLAAATTRYATSSVGNKEGNGTAAFAMITGPEGAVFRASGDLSNLQLQPRSISLRRVRTDGPFYIWSFPDRGGTLLTAFLRPLHRSVAEIQEEGFDINLPETVPGSRLPAITLVQVNSLQAASNGMQAGIGLSRKMDGGGSIWSRVGLGLTRVRAHSQLLHLATVDQVMISGSEVTGSKTRTIPSAIVSIGITQDFGTGHSISLFLNAEADKTPVLNYAGDGSARIGFASAHSLTLGISFDWRF